LYKTLRQERAGPWSEPPHARVGPACSERMSQCRPTEADHAAIICAGQRKRYHAPSGSCRRRLENVQRSTARPPLSVACPAARVLSASCCTACASEWSRLLSVGQKIRPVRGAKVGQERRQRRCAHAWHVGRVSSFGQLSSLLQTLAPPITHLAQCPKTRSTL
jgi:hypothetical protein